MKTGLIIVVGVLVAFAHHCLGQVVTAGTFDVTVTEVSGQTLSFDTGPGMPDASNTVGILIYDKCRIEGRGQSPIGSFFPTSTVTGIEAEVSGVSNAPGAGNTIAYTFVEGMEDNTAIFTKDQDTNTATISFCVELGLYTNGYLSNWEEVKIVYSIDLTTDINNQGDPVVFIASASNFLASLGVTALDENGLASYFCDPDTQEEVSPGSTMRQGSVISICFNVIEGEFEVEDIMDLIVEDLGESSAAQSIIVANEYSGTGWADKWCVRTDATTETCVVSFMLKAAFYDYNAAELTGEGAAIVELGAAGRKKRKLMKFGIGTKGPRRLTDSQTVAPTRVKPKAFKVEKLEGLNDQTAASGAIAAKMAQHATLTVAATLGFFLHQWVY